MAVGVEVGFHYVQPNLRTGKEVAVRVPEI